MTDDDLNRLVADERVMNAPLEPPCPRYHSTDSAEYDSSDGWSGWCYTCGCSISEVTPEPPRYCTDPARWGALLMWLAEQRRYPSVYFSQMDSAFVAEAMHPNDGSGFVASDPLPGRALVIATLRAWGVEVPE